MLSSPVLRRLLLVGLAILLALPAFDADARRRRRRRRYAPAAGYLEINSTTTGAQVFVDGRLVGRIPLESKIKVRTGKHTVKIVKRGFTQYLDVVRVRRRKTTKVDIDLLPVSGAVKVTANVKEARVFIDGAFVGLTPVDVDVQPGKRSLRVQKAGYHDFIRSIDSVAGQLRPITVELEAMAVGTTPYRPAPPPPPKWYEKWYVWAGAAGALVAVAVGIIVPVALSQKDPIGDFNAEHAFKAK